MLKTDAVKFGKILGALAKVFDKQPSEELTVIYFGALEDLPIELVEKAAAIITRTGKFFPKPAEIRELCEGSAEEQIQNAWNLLNQAYRKAGEMDSVCFQDRALAYAVLKTFTTWTNCANELYTLSDEMLAFKKKEFGKNYKLGQKLADQSTPLYFPGRAETNNRQTVANWTVALEEYNQPVYLVGATEIIQQSLPFNGKTAQLTETGAGMLAAFQNGLQIAAGEYPLLSK